MLQNLAYDTLGEREMTIQMRHVLSGRACSRPDDLRDLLWLCQQEVQALPINARIDHISLELEGGYAGICYTLPPQV